MSGAPEIWIDQSGFNRGKSCIVLSSKQLKSGKKSRQSQQRKFNKKDLYNAENTIRL